MKKIITLLFVLMSCFLQASTLPQLTISSNQKYIVDENGSPFFWLGDTAWEMLHRLNLEETEIYLEDRSNKGFNVIQTVILAELNGINSPNANGDLPLKDNDPTKLNEAYFKHVDRVIKLAEKNGLYIAFLPTWGDKINKKWGAGPEIFTVENAQIYGKLLAERYHDHTNIIWVLGGDRSLDNENHLNIINAMAKGIRSADQNNLISFHPVGAKLATDFINTDWLQLDMYQSGHSRSAKEYEYVWKSRQKAPLRPVINGEARYENIPDKFWEQGEHPWLDDADVRTSAYWSILAGAAGYTYGCNDIWQMYETHQTPVIQARTGWKAALKLPGATQMAYMRMLFEYFDWQNMTNEQSLILNENSQNQDFCMCAVGQNKDFLLAYTPTGRKMEIDLTEIKLDNIKAWWFNPRSGSFKYIGTFNTQTKQDFTPWASGRGSDFILVVTDTSKDFNKK